MQLTSGTKGLLNVTIVAMLVFSGFVGMMFAISDNAEGEIIYIYDEHSYQYVDITRKENEGAVQLEEMEDDDVRGPIDIGFAAGFEFYGQIYTQLYISSNGFISFQDNGRANENPTGSIPDRAAPNAVVAALWLDIDPGENGEIWHWIDASETPERFIIEWHNVEIHGQEATFEMFLLSNGDIVFKYYAITPGSFFGDVPTVGVESADGDGTPYDVVEAKELDDDEGQGRALIFTSKIVEDILSFFHDDMEDQISLTNKIIWENKRDMDWDPSDPNDADFRAYGLWHVSSHRARSGSYSWYYGNEAERDYETFDDQNVPTQNQGNLTSRKIGLAHQETAVLEFWHYLSVQQSERGKDYDDGHVDMWNGSGWEEVESFDHTFDYGTRQTEWQLATVDLTKYSGDKYKDVELKFRFRFDTLDNHTNSNEGWFIDDVSIISRNKDMGVVRFHWEPLILKNTETDMGTLKTQIAISAEIQNFGNTTQENIPVLFSVVNEWDNTVHSNTAYITRNEAGTPDSLGEKTWLWDTDITGFYKARVQIYLNGDEFPNNDYWEEEFEVNDMFYFDDMTSSNSDWTTSSDSSDTYWRREAAQSEIEWDTQHWRLRGPDGTCNCLYEEPSGIMAQGDEYQYTLTLNKEVDMTTATYATFGFRMRYDISESTGFFGSTTPDSGSIQVKVKKNDPGVGSEWRTKSQFTSSRWGDYFDWSMTLTPDELDDIKSIQVRFVLVAIHQAYFTQSTGAGWAIDDIFIIGHIRQPKLTITDEAITDTTIVPGVNTLFNVTVENSGNQGDSPTIPGDDTEVNMEADAPEGWAVTFGTENPQRVYNRNINPGASYTIPMNVLTPSGERSGTYSINITGNLSRHGEILCENVQYCGEAIKTVYINVLDYHGIELKTPEAEREVAPSVEVEYNISVRNTGNGDDTFTYEANIVESDLPKSMWTVSLTEFGDYFSGFDDDKYFILTIRTPSTGAFYGNFSVVNVTVRSQENTSIFENITLTTTVSKSMGVRLCGYVDNADIENCVTTIAQQYAPTPEDSTRNVAPRIFEFYVWNPGNLPGIILLDVAMNQDMLDAGWRANLSEGPKEGCDGPCVFKSAFTIDDGSPLVAANVEFPGTTPPGVYEIFIRGTAFDSKGDAITDTLTLKMHVLRSGKINIGVDTTIKIAEPTETVEFRMAVRNNLNFATNVDIDVTKSHDDWTVQLLQDNRVVELIDTNGNGIPNLDSSLNAWTGERYIIIRITAPETALYEVDLDKQPGFVIKAIPSAVPEDDQALFLGEQKLTVQVEKRFKLHLGPENATSDVQREIDPGLAQSSVRYNLTLWNYGNIQDTIQLQAGLSPSSDGFTITFDPPTVTLAPYTSTLVVVTVRVDALGSALTPDPGPYRISASAISNVARQQEGLTINSTSTLYAQVKQVFRLNMNYGAGEAQVKEQGSTATYSLNIENQGNGDDVITLSIKGQDSTWARLSQSSLTLGKYAPQTVNLVITLPADAEPGTHYITVEAVSNKDPTAVHSLQVPIVVEEKPNILGVPIQDFLIILIIAAVVAIIAGLLISGRKKPSVTREKYVYTPPVQMAPQQFQQSPGQQFQGQGGQRPPPGRM